MHRVEPKVFLVGETREDGVGIGQYLAHIGAQDWSSPEANSSPELMTELMGRICYRSWAPGLNPNVTKVRNSNADYLSNILRSGHGSVLEHASVNFIFADVSRVFTHELVRHRVGASPSQESLRFVRLDDLGLWAPTVIREDPEAMLIFSETFRHLEDLQLKLAEHFKLDGPGVPFSIKKTITSAMRRLAPDGLATTIGWTANMRTLRWCIEARTSRHAEEEIRLVFDKVAQICSDRYPNLFADFSKEIVDGINEWKPENRKV